MNAMGLQQIPQNRRLAQVKIPAQRELSRQPSCSAKGSALMPNLAEYFLLRPAADHPRFRPVLARSNCSKICALRPQMPIPNIWHTGKRVPPQALSMWRPFPPLGQVRTSNIAIHKVIITNSAALTFKYGTAASIKGVRAAKKAIAQN
jgi:hypothetical protein